MPGLANSSNKPSPGRPGKGPEGPCVPGLSGPAGAPGVPGNVMNVRLKSSRPAWTVTVLLTKMYKRESGRNFQKVLLTKSQMKEHI